MALHYSNGFGKIRDKETGETALDIKYQLIETDQTMYTSKKWWGELTLKKEMNPDRMYVVEFADNRKGECIVITDSEKKQDRSREVSNYHYRFYGRGRLGWR